MTLIQQQRLLGAVLLLCLIGVIAWFLLDKVEQNQPPVKQEEPIAFDSVIEPIPDNQEVLEPPQEKLVDPQGLEQQAAPATKPVEQQADPAVTASESKPDASADNSAEPQDEPVSAPARPEPAQPPKPEATRAASTEPSQAKPEQNSAQPMWVLQLASFSVRENADSLAKQLKSMGYDPMIETISSAGTLIYRVRLQPVADRIKLEQTAQDLSKKLKLNTQIMQHRP